jgi:hypothetical protein
MPKQTPAEAAFSAYTLLSEEEKALFRAMIRGYEHDAAVPAPAPKPPRKPRQKKSQDTLPIVA